MSHSQQHISIWLVKLSDISHNKMILLVYMTDLARKELVQLLLFNFVFGYGFSAYPKVVCINIPNKIMVSAWWTDCHLTPGKVSCILLGDNEI